MSTRVTVGGVADRRRRTTASVFSDAGIADGAKSCHLHPVDTADYSSLENGSVSVRFPLRLRGVYTAPDYMYIEGMRRP